MDPAENYAGGDPGVEVTTETATSGGLVLREFSEAGQTYSFTPETYNATTLYSIDDLEDDPGPPGGGPSGDPDWGDADLVGSQLEDGTAFSGIPFTTWVTEQFELNETVDPDVTRAHYTEFDDGLLDASVEIELEEGEEPVEYYAWENTEAVLHDGADEWALEDGVVGWRSNEGCSDIGGCLDEPFGLVDFLDTTGLAWSSSISITDGEHSILTTGDDANVNQHGRHSFAFNVDVQEEDPPEEIEATAAIEGEVPAAAHDSLSEAVEMSTSFGATVVPQVEEGPGGG